jgi:hypothetical protein
MNDSLIKKSFLIIPFAVSIISCRQNTNVWTKDYEQRIYDTLYHSSAIAGKIKDTNLRKPFIKYLVQKYKVAIPYGFYSISNDSLERLSEKITEEYTGVLKGTAYWEDEFEASLRNSLIKQYFKKDDNSEQNELCTCVLSKLKYMYPDSIAAPISDSLENSVVQECESENKKP